MKSRESWGRYPQVEQQTHALVWRTDALPKKDGSLLPHGLGRSYLSMDVDGRVVRLDSFSKVRPVCWRHLQYP